MHFDRREKVLRLFQDGQCIPAIPLALNSNRQFDAKLQEKLVDYYLEAGVGGIAIGVHTTQFEIHSPEYNLLEPVLRTVKNRIEEYEKEHNKTIIRVAGVTGPTIQASEEARLAKALGYDFVLLSIGGLDALNEDDLIERTQKVSSIIPCIAFSMQVPVGGRIGSEDYWDKICEIENVVGIKCAPFNRYETLKIARSAAFAERKTPLTLYTGNDDHIILDLLTPLEFRTAEGDCKTVYIKGGLLGHWSVWTKAAVRLFEELKAFRLSGKSEVPLDWLIKASQLTELNGYVFDADHNFSGCIPGIHQVLVNDGHLNNVLMLNQNEILSEGQADKILQAAKAYPYLTDAVEESEV